MSAVASAAMVSAGHLPDRSVGGRRMKDVLRWLVRHVGSRHEKTLHGDKARRQRNFVSAVFNFRNESFAVY
jgi:hypothetical protein